MKMQNIVRDDALFVRFDTSDIISISNKLPISDDLGKNITGINENVHGYVEFSVKNITYDTVNYEVYLTPQIFSGKKIKDNYIKFYLTDQNNVPLSGFDKNLIPSYYDFFSLVDNASSKLLYSGSLDEQSEKNFKLRVWLSDTYAISDYVEKFSVDVNVRVK